MTPNSEMRRNSARLRQLANYLRGVHFERHGLSLRSKTRPNGQGLKYLLFNIATDGKALNSGKENVYQKPSVGQGKPV
ncbi:MAG: hypothetical protein MKZ93_04955, partial [Prochlorococcus sp. ALOHA_A2.0_51]|nr:hypothetical protein [Prochlorococcus sp. ALOHA_A2.0_51]